MHRLVLLISAIFIIGLQSTLISRDAADAIIYYTSENDGSGDYHFSFETANGTRRQETGVLINAGEADQYTRVHGSYFYKDTNQQEHSVYYTADKYGFQILPAPKPYAYYSFPPSVVATLLGG